MKVRLETWTSDHSRTERHYFIEGGDRGYQHNTYLFGYNPELVSERLVKKILIAILGALDENNSRTNLE